MAWLLWQGLWPTKPKMLPILPYTLKWTSKCLRKSRLQFSFVMFRKITIFSDLPFPRFCKMMLFSLHIEWVWKSNVIESGWESTCTLRNHCGFGTASVLHLICVWEESTPPSEFIGSQCPAWICHYLLPHECKLNPPVTSSLPLPPNMQMCRVGTSARGDSCTA